MLNAGQGGRAGGWRGMRLGGLPRAQAAFVPQELTTVRVQDPRVQNEGSWNSYVDYKIFLHVSCGCWKRGGDLRAHLPRCLSVEMLMPVFFFSFFFCVQDQQQGFYSQDLMCAAPVPGIRVAEATAPEECWLGVSMP